MTIEYDKRAKKFIEAQDRPTKQRIKKAIEGLTEQPPKGDIKTMQGYHDGRLRLRSFSFVQIETKWKCSEYVYKADKSRHYKGTIFLKRHYIAQQSATDKKHKIA